MSKSLLIDEKSSGLEFRGPIAIVGGGTVDLAILQALAGRGVVLIGTEGGGDSIGAAGLMPAAIIGDLDSLRERDEWEKKTKVIQIAEQVTTDFQKCLYSTIAPVTLLVGMTGKRLDHSLTALSLVLRYAPTRRLILVDEVDVALAVVGSFNISSSLKERVSIHPLLPIVFRNSSGLRYPLDGLLLEPGGATGTSNEATAATVCIVPEGMTPWLLILGKERLWDLVEAASARSTGNACEAPHTCGRFGVEGQLPVAGPSSQTRPF
jgi:thiamine pyrophosphokinase